MHWNDIPFRPALATLRRFGLFGFLIFGGVAGWQLGQQRWVAGGCLLVLSLVLGALAWVSPGALRPIFVGLLIIAFPVNWLASHLVLAVIYFGVFAPVGLFFRLVGRDALMLRRRPTADTFWTDKPEAKNVRSYFRQG